MLRRVCCGGGWGVACFVAIVQASWYEQEELVHPQGNGPIGQQSVSRANTHHGNYVRANMAELCLVSSSDPSGAVVPDTFTTTVPARTVVAAETA